MKDLKARTRGFAMLSPRLVVKVLFAALLAAAPFHAALAQSPPDLGTAESFAVLGGTEVTCTNGIVNGDVGVDLGVITSCTVTGTMHTGDPIARKAYTDFRTAYTALAAEPCGVVLTGTLAGVTLPPGVYCFDSGATLTGVLTLNGPSDGVWIFKIGTSGSGALTATNFTMVMSGGGGACHNNVFWWTADGATLTDSVFKGTILAGMDVTITRESYNGRALAKGRVTLTDTSVSWPSITVNPADLSTPVLGVPYGQTVTGSGGSAPYTFAVTSGALPTGLELNPTTGQISGTPTAGGAFNFTITATDFSNCSGSQAYTVIVNPSGCSTIVLDPAILPGGAVGVAYNEVLSATGGVGPYSFTVTSGNLPVGLTLSSHGVLSGTPTASGTSSFTVTATDDTGCTGSKAYTVIINPSGCPTIEVGPATLPAGTVGVTYNEVFSAIGGAGPYSFVVTTGSLPVGLMLSPHGVLAGMPAASGTSSFTITATDDHGCTGSQEYTLLINPADCPTIVVGPATLPGGTVGAVYSQSLSATGGAGPYSFAVTAGSLPSGLTLSWHGVLAGTPTATGVSNFTVTATDANGCTGAKAYALSVVNVVGPVISLMKKVTPPFTLVVTGSNLQEGIEVYINGSQWPNVSWKNVGKIKIKGGALLKAAVPKNTPTQFRFVNPDGGEVTLTWQY